MGVQVEGESKCSPRLMIFLGVGSQSGDIRVVQRLLALLDLCY